MSRPTHHYVCLFSINGILDYIGRIDCEDTGRECLDEDSNSRECCQDLGDARVLPDANLLVHEILDFFSDNFGFNAQETVALMGFAPGWAQQTVVNGGSIPDRIQWTRGRTQDTARIISLNTDIGLARDLTGEIDSDGDVSCNFKNPAPRCPVASQTMDWMTTYRYDEEKFLEDSESVLKKIIIAGYMLRLS
ncbi:hypothetical protein QTG54_003318 [Skeletonema marinoi]|uniref:Uncharacterized protein n=1 Tax=Skeletonema marinoi TaxID=267567 RepID=A0AAD9DGP7_9STRA|nr:hypothetical protein QTG54_003318 [Skeletonema marinoi]